MFSRSCEYGLKAAIYIAKHSDNKTFSSVKEISKATDSPEAFTAKILQQLVKSKIISSQKGPNGGFYISKDIAKKIKLIDIVQSIDGDQIFNGCALGLDQCDEKKPCPLHDKFKNIRNELKVMLVETNLYDLSADLEQGMTFLKL